MWKLKMKLKAKSNENPLWVCLDGDGFVPWYYSSTCCSGVYMFCVISIRITIICPFQCNFWHFVILNCVSDELRWLMSCFYQGVET